MLVLVLYIKLTVFGLNIEQMSIGVDLLLLYTTHAGPIIYYTEP